MQGRTWTKPVAEPIRCSECGAPLTAEEVEFYGLQCEHCTKALDARLQNDIDREPGD